MKCGKSKGSFLHGKRRGRECKRRARSLSLGQVNHSVIGSLRRCIYRSKSGANDTLIVALYLREEIPLSSLLLHFFLDLVIE